MINYSLIISIVFTIVLFVYLKNKLFKQDQLHLKELEETKEIIRLFINDWSNNLVIKSKKPLTTEQILEVMNNLSEMQYPEQHNSDMVTLKCDICNHQWKSHKPHSNRIECPNCKLNVEYEIIF